MSMLDIEFHCLCVFVPDPENDVVHVLMPSTLGAGENGHRGHGGHAATGSPRGEEEASPTRDAAGGGHGHVHDLHVVRIVHDGLQKRLPMEGWGLRLGRVGGTINLDLESARNRGGAEILDMNDHTGLALDPALLEEEEDPRVIARVTLREGYLLGVDSDVEWLMKGRPVRMATRGTWRIDDYAGGTLDWKRLGATGCEPLETFDDLPVEENGARHVHIYHTTPKGLRPPVTSLTPDEVREHFRVFLELYGIGPDDDPRGVLLPRYKGEPFVGANCPLIQGSPKPR